MFIVAGIGTDVGKTVASAILTYALDAEYWKPVQCGPCGDRETVENLLQGTRITHPEAIRLKMPRSPHHAAAAEGFMINPEQIVRPRTSRTLVIEGCGGLLVPLNNQTTMADLFATWDCSWILVARMYLGMINHTLLTIEAMKRRSLNLCGIIFNGDECPQSESAILALSGSSCIGRIKEEKTWDFKRIKSYANDWKKSGTLFRKMGIEPFPL